MVRPKGSTDNIRAALAFTEIILVREGQSTVPFKGPGSIFAAVCECLPDLARASGENQYENRRGVSCVELNKSLQMIGLRTKRNRSNEGGNCKVIMPQIYRKSIADGSCKLFKTFTSIG
jgi:hypothetical protein